MKSVCWKWYLSRGRRDNQKNCYWARGWLENFNRMLQERELHAEKSKWKKNNKTGTEDAIEYVETAGHRVR